MDLHHQFNVSAPVEESWPAFLDMPRIAPCLPGAEITEVIDDRNVKGAAKVKVGPVNLRFAGQAEMSDIDEANHAAHLTAKGSDAKGRGNAEALVNFRLSPADSDTTLVDVNTTLKLTGSVAQYGRVSGLIDEIANQIIAEFVTNLEAELATTSGSAAESASPTAATTPETATTPTTAGETSTAAASSVASPPAKAVSGLALLFKALLASIKKRFSRS